VGMVVEEVASLQAVQGPHRLSSPSMIRNVNDWRATPLVTKLYYVNGKDNHPRYELMEKQLKNAGYNYERWPGQMITHINQVEPVWNQMLRNSTLPKEPWWNGWINRNYCWHDHEYWGARTPQMVGTVACCLNYIALLAHILEESQGHPDNAVCTSLPTMQCPPHRCSCTDVPPDGGRLPPASALGGKACCGTGEGSRRMGCHPARILGKD